MIISTGDSRKSKNWTPQEISWGDLVEKLRSPVRTGESCAQYEAMSRDERAAVKDVGGFVAGRLRSRQRGAEAVEDRCMVCLDADFPSATGALDQDTWACMVGCRAVMHTTHSHTPENPRLRLLIPLSRPVTAQEYEPIARRIASWLDMEAFDDTTYQPNRLMYWPSCPADGEYQMLAFPGPDVDPDEVLSTYADWRDMRQWPVSSRRQRVIVKMGEKQGDPLQKPGVIGAFNRAYSITAAIETYLPGVYAQAGPDRWTYCGGSTTGGAVSYDGDTFLYSHHDTDPISGRLCSAFDLVRLHLYGDQDADFEDDNLAGGVANAPSMRAMKELCVADERVRAELADGLTIDAAEAFDGMPDVGQGLSRSLEAFDGDMSEQGAACEFCRLWGGNLRHNGSLGWLYWDGARWLTDAEAEAKILIMRYADMLYSEARMAQQTCGDEKYAKARADALMKRATKIRTSGGLNSLVQYCKALLNDPQTSDYDGNAWELNTPGGIVDLKSGAMRPHARSAKHTKMAAVAPQAYPEEGGAAAPAGALWQDFLAHISGGDKDFEDYLQMVAGMAAIGEVCEEGLVISYGPGGNGKSTYWGALRKVLGEYARGINADVLVAAGGKTDQSYVAALRGARLVVMGETEEGAKLGVANMKRLTSRDTISARALYKDPIEFVPSHTTVMHTNHLPKLKSLDGGTRRRIAVAPFPATLPPEKVVTNFERHLVEKCGGEILRWIIDGAVAFYRAGCKLKKPACVVKATQEYLEGEDWLKGFIDEYCEVDGRYFVGATTLWATYRKIAEEEGSYPRYKRDFAHAMEQAGYCKVHRDTGNYWLGIRLKNVFEEVRQDEGP